jgi:hypothetical protein
LKSRKGYLAGGIAVFPASIPYLQLILPFRPSTVNGDGIFPLSALARLDPSSVLEREMEYQALKCKLSPLARLDNFWPETPFHFTLIHRTPRNPSEDSPTSAIPMIVA